MYLCHGGAPCFTEWLRPLRNKRAADVAEVTGEFLPGVGGNVGCFQTYNGTGFVNKTFSRL